MTHVEIPLGRTGMVALVDVADAERVQAFKWHAHCSNKSAPTPKWYAVRRVKVNGRKHKIRLHRWLMNAPDGIEVDHQNGDSLDCRRENLRFADEFEQAANRSKNGSATVTTLKGVERAYGGRWRVRFQAHGRRYNVGTFATEEEAAFEYDRLARAVYGDFARLNFQDSTESSTERKVA